MNGQSTRLVKEARQLLAPWCGLALAGLLAMAQRTTASAGSMRRWPELVVAFGITIAIPVLATLPFGYDHQWRTMPLLLSQPIERATIWREKVIVTWASILPLAALYLFLLRVGEHADWQSMLAAASWLLITTAAAAPATLYARSTVGGIAINTTAGWIFVYVLYLVTRHQAEPEIWRLFYSPSTIAFSASAMCVYAVAATWLGRRMFVQYQEADSSSGTEFLARVGAKVVPQAVSDLLRSRAGSPLLNLVRRELHLLRPVWPLTLLSALAWTAMLVFHLVPVRGVLNRNPTSTAALIGTALSAMLVPLIGLLAGALSLSEEKNLGTHAWHMTLPLSPRVQWLVKMTIAIAVAAICGGLVPAAVLAIGGMIRGGDVFYHLEPTIVWLWPLAASGIAALAFWAACVVKGTVRAVLFVFPVLFVFGLVIEPASWLADKAVPALSHPIGEMLIRLDPFRVTAWTTIQQLLNGWIFLWVLPVVLFLLAQSAWKFRGQSEDTNRHFIACLLPVVSLVFVCTFALTSTILILNMAETQKGDIFRETNDAIQKLQGDTHALDSSAPAQFTAADLSKTSLLSDTTQHWLGTGVISVTKPVRQDTHARPGHIYFTNLKTPLATPFYRAELSLTNGYACTMYFWSFGGSNRGTITAACR